MPELCSVCLEQDSKYTCPACDTKTCSVECVKRHKLRTECSGQIDPTQFIANKELASSQTLVNRDYNYLLNFERKIQLGKTDVKSNAGGLFKRTYNSGRNVKRQRPNEAVDPRRAQVNEVFPNNPQTSIKRENTLVIHVSPGMSRATQNKTGYDKKSGCFTWTVEWQPVDKEGQAGESFISYRLKESLPLKDSVPLNVLEKSLGSADLKPDDLFFYLHNCINTSSKVHSLIRLDPNASLSAALKDKVVLEYPKICITLASDVWEEYVQTQGDAYGLVETSSESESDSESSSDSDSSESDSGSDSDDAPEELSSRPPTLPPSFATETTSGDPIDNTAADPKIVIDTAGDDFEKDLPSA